MAREEAIRLHHDYVGTEHILLGLIADGGGEAVRILGELGVSPEAVRASVHETVREGKAVAREGELPYTSRTRKVLEYARGFAADAGVEHVGTEHILAGLLAEKDGIAAKILNKHGATLEEVTAAVGVGVQPSIGEAATQAAAAPRFRIRIDDSAAVSIYEQIIGQIQEAVATGQLRPGDRLPTVRQLADDLDIAPGTVARAYGELERLGILVTEGARGTRVAEQQKPLVPDAERPNTLVGLLRPVAVAAFHLGASADELRAALEEAMKGIYDQPAA
ncbi:MAG TPA: Clp protease N-terminal domain-containing protein [Longimicrobiales bacterium]